VSQISPPIRIVLALAVAFLVAWMTILKPKADVVETTPTPTTGNVATGEPAVSAPGKIAQTAKDAVTNANAKQSAAMGETTGGTGTATGTAKSEAKAAETATTAATAGVLAGLPKPVVKAITTQKILVLLFWNPKSVEDRAVRSAVRKVDRWDGRVWVKAVPIERISRYGRVTRGVDVQQSPTVVVVDRKLAATSLVGFVDRQTIDQAVVDALRNSGGLFTSGYLRKVSDLCSRTDRKLFAIVEPNQPSQARRYVSQFASGWSAFAADLRGIAAPARFAGFKRSTVADATAVAAAAADWSKALGSKPSAARLASTGPTFMKRVAPIDTRFQARMRDQHVLACAE
jgi:hypothetical protein